MPLYAHGKFLPKKNFVLSDHRSFGVLILLQTREWIGSLIKLSEYVECVVKEFYANLSHDFLDPNSPHFEKVSEVNGIPSLLRILHCWRPVFVALDRDEMLSELVGQRMQWSPNTALLVSTLTNMYDVLHKFSTTN